MTVANSVDEIRQASRQLIHKMQIRVVCGLARRRGGSSDAGRSRAALGERHDRSIEGTQKHSLALWKRQTRFGQTNCWWLYDCRLCYSSLFRRVSYESWTLEDDSCPLIRLPWSASGAGQNASILARRVLQPRREWAVDQKSPSVRHVSEQPKFAHDAEEA